MKPAFVKKNTEGGAAGLSWEAGEVKALNPYLADELVKLSPEDYEVVQDGEYTPEPPAHNSPEFGFPSVSSDGQGINFDHPRSIVVEEPLEGSAEENAAIAQSLSEAPEKPKRAYNKKSDKTTETPSAE